jgi:rubrerythrin
MADQEVGHATLISNMLGERAPKQCTYKYDFDTVPE